MKYRILVTSRSFGQVSDEAIHLLNDADFQIDYMVKDFRMEAFEAAIPDYDALIIGAHLFDPALFPRCPKLRIICKHGVGLDNIPVEAAKRANVIVTNTPGTNSDAVADFAMALILASSRNLVFSVNALKAGELKPRYGTDIYKKKLGLLGFGAIARRVAKRALGFDMDIVAYDPYVMEAPEGLGCVRLCSFEEVLRESDVLSIHLPITPETRGMIGKDALELMKPTARIINTARGGIVDEQALCEAIKAGKLAGAALDVLEKEPAPPDSPLLSMPEVIVTNHIASYSVEALNAVSMICASNIIHCFKDEPVLYKAW